MMQVFMIRSAKALTLPLLAVCIASATGATGMAQDGKSSTEATQSAKVKKAEQGEQAEQAEQAVKKRAMPDLSQERLLPLGITPKIERSIQRGLKFLARSQNRDGSWRNSGGYGSYPVAMTALAGVALAMSGSTATQGQYASHIRRSVDFLINSALPSGLITAINEEARPMYGHGFSTMYLAEIYGMETDAKRQRVLHRILSKAVKLTAKSQSFAGGWLYAPDDSGDEGSVTITQVQGLRACRNAGIAVPIKVIKKAIKYIVDSANPDGGIRYTARSGGSSRPPITAAACAVLYSAGKYDHPIAKKSLEYAKRHVPLTGGGHHYYAHLYLAQALYQQGGKDWAKYLKDMSRWLMRQQRSDGSWMGDSVGTTYGTAIALTILQLPYAHLPIYQR